MCLVLRITEGNQGVPSMSVDGHRLVRVDYLIVTTRIALGGT